VAISKIIDRNQLGRVKQIELQLNAPQVVLREDMIEKLQITEEQVEMINEISSEHRNVQRENGRGRRDLMKTAFESLPNRPDAQAANNGQGGNNGGGGGRGNRGGGGPGGAAWNDPATREAMQKYMERPEVKAKMAEFQTQEEKLQDQFVMAVSRALTKRQLTIYKKMLGAPFDLSKIRGGGPGRGPWNNQATAAATKKAQPGVETKTTTAKPAASDADDDDDAAPATTATATPPATPKTTAPTTAKTKRKNSLRAARGLDD
jgi:hypothetical protein